MTGAAEIVAELRSLADPAYRADMEPRYGIVAPTALGVRMADLKVMAKRIGRNHDLALALWEADIYDARLLVSMIADPARVTPELMDRWRADFDNWGICDTLCFNLFDRTPHAFDKIDQWAALNDEFGRRASFALLASIALHGKKLPDAPFIERLALIERASTDPRNFVRKAVNWALRGIGTRNAACCLAATETAERLAASSDRTARWIGKDALKALKDPKKRAKLGL